VRRLLSTIGACLLAVSLTATAALACRAPEFERTSLFATVPDEISAPVGLHVTLVYTISGPRGSSHRGPTFYPYSYVGSAQINRVIKGTVTETEVMLVAPATDCDHPFQIRNSGYVFGEPRRNGFGGPTKLDLLITMLRPAFKLD
jgi:hypothetical protein